MEFQCEKPLKKHSIEQWVTNALKAQLFVVVFTSALFDYSAQIQKNQQYIACRCYKSYPWIKLITGLLF